MAVTQAEIDTITRFVADREKQLDGRQPEWVKSGRGDFQAAWPVREQDGRIRGQLRFRVHPDELEYPSISLIFRGNNVMRIDLVSPDECEPNPVQAAQLGLPPVVCGPHIHRWEDNRALVLASGVWGLPVRAPVEHTIRSIEQMFLWFCGEVGIQFDSTHRRFVEPPKDLLSGIR